MIEKKKLAMYNNVALFKDSYGVLQLAADTTIVNSLKPPKLTHHVFTKGMRKVFITISKFWKNNSIQYPDSIEVEPNDFINKLYWEARQKK